MGLNKELLLKTAARLYSLGIDLDAARDKVMELVNAGVSYESKDMSQAVHEYMELKRLWDGLEQEYLALRDSITESGNI